MLGHHLKVTFNNIKTELMNISRKREPQLLPLNFENVILIMDISKAPALRLKALSKHTHIMYIEMENVIKEKRRRKNISTKCHA